MNGEKGRALSCSTGRACVVALLVAGAAGALATKFGEKAVEEFYDHSQSREVI
jgi:hypothetical protein